MKYYHGIICIIRKIKLLISRLSLSFVDTCAICLQDIISDGISHQICSSNFHRDHLASWFILGKQNCPYCKYSFDPVIIQELNPKTKEELERLKKIAEVFGVPGKKEIKSKPRKNRPEKNVHRKNTPRIVDKKWLLYYYGGLPMIPFTFLACFLLFLIVGTILLDLGAPYNFLLFPWSILLLATLAGIKTSYKTISKKVIYQPKMVA